ncbi:MAG TPA: thioredoxin domain-containing protein [Mycobacteriales bacterium]|nr:thioredoxin domain-containing protein [Mycobacteriales bacterium]
MPNRLADATSPYLLQHKDNPVEWWEWSAEAFAEARRRDVPILLSVGYAACHWCHVMAHESFENAEVAAAMNADYVCIKVDREERPDIDSVYMEATQAMTGNGGWPMTVFATPDGAPFFCGTYFPPQPRMGIPSFPQLLAAVAEAWRERRGELESVSADVTGKLNAADGLPLGGEIGPGPLAAGVVALAGTFDATDGGFGGAPKFPPSMVLEYLLRHSARTGDADSLRMAEATCDAMARGGMYDQLAGGFARYSVDNSWVVPHFEKMLYDNALLLRVYVHLWRQTGSALARRVAVDTAEFLLRDLRTPDGGFSSALDADTDGVEGSTYVWNPTQLADVLGAEDGAWAAELLSVTAAGTFEAGFSTLQLRTDPSDVDRWNSVRQRLLTSRGTRPQPGLDDKVVTAWNGLAIAALADAGAILGDQSYVDAAVAAATLLLDLHLIDGRLRRTSRLGRVGRSAGILEDYGDLAEGLLALHQATADGRWLGAAGELLDVALARFGDDAGSFFDTADDAEQLVRRPQDPTDNATPAGASALAGALLSYSALTASTRHREVAEAIVARSIPLIERYPRAAGWAAAVAEALVAGPYEVAVVGEPTGRAELERVARSSAAPGLVVVAGSPGQPGVPLLADRPLLGGAAAAYVCRGFVCAAPVSDPDALRAALSVHP